MQHTYHIEVQGVMQTHADTITEARDIAARLAGWHGLGDVTITCTDGIGYRLVEIVPAKRGNPATCWHCLNPVTHHIQGCIRDATEADYQAHCRSVHNRALNAAKRQGWGTT